MIAKRTFRAQHLHEDLVQAEAAGEEKGSVVAADISDDSNKRLERGGDVPPKKRHKRNASNEGSRNNAQNENLPDGNIHEIANESSETSSSSENGDEVGQGDDNGDGASNENMVDLRAQWDSLLDERQEMDSKDDISAWLDKVVETSERFKKASRRSTKKAKQAEKS